MCGIVGYIGKQSVKGILLEGLKRLEYRGYDSAGLAVFTPEGFRVSKTTGRVAGLAQVAARRPMQGTLGISHTRWATHGGVTDANAHPHLSSDGRIALVHNRVPPHSIAVGVPMAIPTAATNPTKVASSVT